MVALRQRRRHGAAHAAGGWSEERRVVGASIGNVFSLPAVFQKIVGSSLFGLGQRRLLLRRSYVCKGGGGAVEGTPGTLHFYSGVPLNNIQAIDVVGGPFYPGSSRDPP